MGNCITCGTEETDILPIQTIFKLPSPLPSLIQDGGFAKGIINLGGLEVCQISTFTKVWATLGGGPDNLGATFYEPSPIPAGFSILGCYSQPNNTPLFGWVLVGKDDSDGALKTPVDYTLVWNSESMKIEQEGKGYIWLPTPPEGYQAVGHIVTTSPEKPPLDKIRCVRSDLIDSCEHEDFIWGEKEASSTTGINVYSLRPITRGTQALGVSVGTFIAQIGEATSQLPLSCLKNTDLNMSYMPNLSQIETLVQAYSPRVYLHPEEEYLPSSVTWFFNNGALLYKEGTESESDPVLIDLTGSNLPQGGSNDDTYWLDLPVEEEAKEKVKKGYLPSSEPYLHVKPMLGATFTDIAIWVFYPFNGPARAKVELINIPLGKIGEHVGDWEHVTLRISNFTGELWEMYFSEHSGGAWVKASELEFEGGNKPVSYASLHGHAFYPKPGLVLQGNSTLGIGIRNDTAKSKLIVDTGVNYVVISAGHLDTVVEPPWLNYYRKWGPKITYEIAIELKEIENKMSGKLKSALEAMVNILPSEVLGEEGPTGPKVKNNWTGDEV